MSHSLKNWAQLKLGQVAEIVTGNTPSTKDPDLYGGGIPFVKPSDLDRAVPIEVTTQTLSAAGSAQARLVRPGAVLVSCIGNLGKVGVAGTSLATNQQINSVEFDRDIVDDRFGYYYCRTLKPWMESEASATTISILNKGKFSEASIRIAPLQEQARIADKLDTVLTRVDACRDRLARVVPLLKRFRQSVLAAATSGRLTEDWRGEDAPRVWGNSSVGVVCTYIGDGPFGSNLKSDDYTDSGARVVRLENIGHLRFERDKQTFVSLEKYHQLSKHTLQPGDLLFSSFVDEEIRVCEFPSDIGVPAINKADCFCLRIDADKCDKKFLLFRLACKSTYDALKELVHGATRPRINLTQLRNLDLALPPPAEQTEIIRRVETLFAFADRLEARLIAAQTAADRLTPALLAKAFRGELVPQDPNDEPAAELLKRLTASRDAAPKAKRGRRSATADTTP